MTHRTVFCVAASVFLCCRSATAHAASPSTCGHEDVVSFVQQIATKRVLRAPLPPRNDEANYITPDERDSDSGTAFDSSDFNSNMNEVIDATDLEAFNKRSIAGRQDYWSQSGGHPSRNGASPWVVKHELVDGPLWRYTDDKNISTRGMTPLIDALRNIYLTAEAGIIHKFAADSKHIWKYDAGARILTTPALMHGSLYLVTEKGEVISLDLQRGKERWRKLLRWEWCSAPVDMSLNAGSGVILLAVGNASLKTKGADCKKTSWMVAFHGDGDVLWTFSAGSPGPLHTAMDSSHVFAVTPAEVTSLDLKTGNQHWTHTLDASSSLVETTADSKARVSSEPEYVRVAIGPKEFLYVTSNPIDKEGGKKSGRLAALHRATGKLVWHTNTDLPFHGGPAVGVIEPEGNATPSVLVVVANTTQVGPSQLQHSGRILAYTADTGTLKNWTFETGSWIASASPRDSCSLNVISSPAIGGDGSVYIGFGNGELYSMRDHNGDGKIEYKSEVSSYSSTWAGTGSFGPAPVSIGAGLLVAAPCKGLLVWKTF